MNDVERTINRYKLKEGITIEDILKEVKEKNIPHNEGGTWVNKNAHHIIWCGLVDSIEVNIAFPKNLLEWDDYDYVLVMDDLFGQPYTPFYGEKLFSSLQNVIGHYNKFMNSLDFLEKVN